MPHDNPTQGVCLQRSLPMARTCLLERKTSETHVKIELNLDGQGDAQIRTGIPFFDHMLQLFCVHGRFDMDVQANGDLDVDFHHTVEDVGLVLGETVSKALGNRVGIRRYGVAVTPMDDALAEVAIDLSNRPFLVETFYSPCLGSSVPSSSSSMPLMPDAQSRL